MCLNPKQIDKTSKTLMHLRARSVGDRVKLQEAKNNSETYPAKGQVSSARGRHILSFERKDQIMPNTIHDVKNTPVIGKRAVKVAFLQLTRNIELARAV